MIKYYSSEIEKGVFIVDEVRVQYIGKVKYLGYWYWDFFALLEDINKADFFDTIFDNPDYETEGFSAAWYDDIEDIIEEFNLELDKKVIDYFKLITLKENSNGRLF